MGAQKLGRQVTQKGAEDDLYQEIAIVEFLRMGQLNFEVVDMLSL